MRCRRGAVHRVCRRHVSEARARDRVRNIREREPVARDPRHRDARDEHRRDHERALEAPSITLAPTGAIFANGGGGGSASAGTGSVCIGPLAENGKASLVVAAGSRCAPGFGGNGAAGTTAATAGAASIAGGGGGGGLGRIVLRTLPGPTPLLATSSLSPGAMSPAFTIVNTLD